MDEKKQTTDKHSTPMRLTKKVQNPPDLKKMNSLIYQIIFKLNLI